MQNDSFLWSVYSDINWPQIGLGENMYFFIISLKLNNIYLKTFSLKCIIINIIKFNLKNKKYNIDKIHFSLVCSLEN